jgi:hypothetical protein
VGNGGAIIHATAWNNGSSAYGLHIRPGDRDSIFNRAWHQVSWT